MKAGLPHFARAVPRCTDAPAMACKHLLPGFVETRPGARKGEPTQPACALKVYPGPARIQICAAHASLGLGPPGEAERDCPYARDGRYPACQWFAR